VNPLVAVNYLVGHSWDVSAVNRFSKELAFANNQTREKKDCCSCLVVKFEIQTVYLNNFLTEKVRNLIQLQHRPLNDLSRLNSFKFVRANINYARARARAHALLIKFLIKKTRESQKLFGNSRKYLGLPI
jgi:hypothetical protein